MRRPFDWLAAAHLLLQSVIVCGHLLRPTSALNRTLWNALLPCDRQIFERPDPPLNSDPSADAAKRQ